jgi:hypothetical protein
MIDAELTRDLTAAAATIFDCMVQPEDSETPITASDVATYCDTTWMAARAHEADMLLGSVQSRQDDFSTVLGYRHAYKLGPAVAARIMSQGHPKDEVIAKMMDEAIALQELDRHEDIFVPELLQFTPKRPELGGVLKRLLSKVKKTDPAMPVTVYSLSEGVRTLVPVNTNTLELYAILGSDTQPNRIVPAQAIIDKARTLGAREYGLEVFDVTINAADYHALYAIGQPI